MSKPILVNMVAESEFTVRGHGVHTAYVEMTKALRKQPEVDIVVNSKKKADIAHIHSTGPYGLWQLLRPSGKKVVSAHIVPDSLVGSLKGGVLLKPLTKLYLKWFYNRADLVLSPSPAITSELHQMGLEKAQTLFNSIDTTNYRTTAKDRLAARAQLGINDQAFVVVGNGQIQPRKRFDLFVKLAEELPETAFFWVGGIPFKSLGADSGKLQKLIKNVPKNLTVTGVIELEDVKKYYQAADLFILPSEQETFGLVIVEAAAAGLPILLRDIPVYQELFGANTLLAKNDSDFLKQIKQVIKTKPNHLKNWEKQSKTIAQKFDSQTTAKQLVDHYKQLLK